MAGESPIPSCYTCVKEGRTDCWLISKGEEIQAGVQLVSDGLGVTTGDLDQARSDPTGLLPKKMAAVEMVYDAVSEGGRQIEEARAKARTRLCPNVNYRVFRLPGQ